ncbi:MAG: phosphoribosylformylglycinamidine synthase subunit PurQ [Rhodospirillaceae bacterium]|nr:phosphoribosylformylglycinamidine synthase subunit PurQ [Rhodospirillaceae bacterium]
MKVAVIVFPGSNCDRDVATAIEFIIGHPVIMVWHRDTELPSVDLIVIPGGFSYGDYLRCGAIAANSPIMRAVKTKADSGMFILGICNGFQILTEIGILPGALIRNVNRRFVCKDVLLRVETTNSIFARKYTIGCLVCLPIAHSEGNYFADKATLDRLDDDDRVAFRYATTEGKADMSVVNPNGSVRNIAGIYNDTRRVLGLMPHPERLTEIALGGIDGKLMFKGIMEAFL